MQAFFSLSVLVISPTQTSYVIIVHRRIEVRLHDVLQAVTYCERHRNLAWPAGIMVELHESAGSAYNVPYLATVLASYKCDNWNVYVVLCSENNSRQEWLPCSSMHV